jgi:hypothetical protein
MMAAQPPRLNATALPSINQMLCGDFLGRDGFCMMRVVPFLWST